MAPKPPPDLQDIIAALERFGPHASLEQLNAAAARQVRGYNSRPQDDLGGLSPDQMYQLLYGDWVSSGALRISRTLDVADVAPAPFFHDARTVMAYVLEHGPIRATEAKNLPRKMVAALLPHLRTFNDLADEDDRAAFKPLNEDDVEWLPIIRHTLMFAGLLVQRKGFRLTRLGTELMDDANAGELFALLFQTLMQKLDLRALDRRDGQTGLQQTLSYSLWRLPTCCKEWASPETLANAAWLDSAKEPPSAWDAASGVDSRHWTFHNRVLDPLVQFGLLEQRLLPAAAKWEGKREFRLSPLYQRFIRVEFNRSD